jgi:hypothetical protein
LVQHAKLFVAQRDPGEAEIPLQKLRRSPFPVLIVSSARSLVFDAVHDALEAGLAEERPVIAGGHHSVQRPGAPFTSFLEAFLTSAEAQSDR